MDAFQSIYLQLSERAQSNKQVILTLCGYWRLIELTFNLRANR